MASALLQWGCLVFKALDPHIAVAQLQLKTRLSYMLRQITWPVPAIATFCTIVMMKAFLKNLCSRRSHLLVDPTTIFLQARTASRDHDSRETGKQGKSPDQSGGATSQEQVATECGNATNNTMVFHETMVFMFDWTIQERTAVEFIMGKIVENNCTKSVPASDTVGSHLCSYI